MDGGKCGCIVDGGRGRVDARHWGSHDLTANSERRHVPAKAAGTHLHIANSRVKRP